MELFTNYVTFLGEWRGVICEQPTINDHEATFFLAEKSKWEQNDKKVQRVTCYFSDFYTLAYQ